MTVSTKFHTAADSAFRAMWPELTRMAMPPSPPAGSSPRSTAKNRSPT